MPNPYPIELRERAVRAYEGGEDTYTDVAERVAINRWTLIRWVRRTRDTGSAAPRAKVGGWVSPVDLKALQRLVGERPDTTTEE